LPAAENMQNSLRKTLIDSHVAAIAIAVLIFTCVAEAFFAVWYPVERFLSSLLTAVATGDIPYIPRAVDALTRVNLLAAFTQLVSALSVLAAAWLLSRWIYGTGPLRSLGAYQGKLSRKTHA
jgi:hypothetical protein